MKDLHYENKTIRMNDKTWERLKAAHRDSGLTWNMFLIYVLKKIKAK